MTTKRPHAPYDPVKSHQYYEEHKKLKGRPTGSASAQIKGHKPVNTPAPQTRQKVVARIGRLKVAISKLQNSLSEAEAALSQARQNERAKAKASSDGKSTAKEKQASQQYRDKHKTELKSKAKAASSSNSSGGSSSSSSSTSVSSMSASALGTRIIKIKAALANAKAQLADATHQLGQLAHSEITSDPEANLHFAQFRSERIPSK